jgi:hypothetical protein
LKQKKFSTRKKNKGRVYRGDEIEDYEHDWMWATILGDGEIIAKIDTDYSTAIVNKKDDSPFTAEMNDRIVIYTKGCQGKLTNTINEVKEINNSYWTLLKMENKISPRSSHQMLFDNLINIEVKLYDTMKKEAENWSKLLDGGKMMGDDPEVMKPVVIPFELFQLIESANYV